MPQRNQLFQPPTAASRQYGGSNYNRMLDQRLQRFLPMMGGGQGGLPMPPGLTRILNGFRQQQPPMSPSQSYPLQGLPSQDYSLQGNASQRYNQGFLGQTPAPSALEEPKKGGIKGFVSNLMDKWKK